ncbi:MAG: hypothetical protein A4S15_13335 [Candidatus Raskinella chloraquaticus]|jgi:hypothetical protein|uniref:Uncharacterized protein n=1 Tax=Candidatus Raskinella chloraquaticus TaxID=1951219 RepID=A0A1W9HU55_9HYPH|nr:MAG: hypothetical protein A4S15_13335 [Proteobacteria bacterium SG_bin8]
MPRAGFAGTALPCRPSALPVHIIPSDKNMTDGDSSGAAKRMIVARAVHQEIKKMARQSRAICR